MKKLALLIAVFGVLMLAASIAQAAGPSAPGKPTMTLNYLEIQTNFATTSAQNQRPRFGDRFWFHSELYAWKAGKRGAHIGHADVSAVFLPSNTVEITGVGYLPGGTLTVAGQSTNQRLSTFSVVGGTGRYATARGELSIRSLGGQNSNRSADTIRLWL